MTEPKKRGARKQFQDRAELHTYLDKELHARVCALADATNKSLSEIVREALSEKLEKETP